MSQLVFSPPPTGRKFMSSDAKVRLILGPVGSGKSTVCVNEIFRRCCEMPRSKDGFRRSRWAVVRNTNQQLKTTTFATWKQWFPAGQVGTWKESEKTFYIIVGDVRAEILFLPLDTPDDAQRLLSLELTGVFFNEAREIAPELITAAFSRLGRYPSKSQLKEPYWYGLIMDTNPPNEDSWLHDKFEVEQPEGWEIFKQPGGLEPDAENRENLPDTYYEDMMNGATEDWIRVHVHGQYGHSMSGKPVFSEFNADFHVAKNPLKPIVSLDRPLIIGMDFGLTPACTINQQDLRGRFLTFAELTSENMGITRFLNDKLKPLLASKFPGHPVIVIGDPAGSQRSQTDERTVFEVLKANGFRVIPARTNSIAARISAVETLLAGQVEGGPRHLIDPSCKTLIRAMKGGYRYKMKKTGEMEDSPEKNSYSHIADSHEYACLHVDQTFGSRGHETQRREVKRVAAVGWT